MPSLDSSGSPPHPAWERAKARKAAPTPQRAVPHSAVPLVGRPSASLRHTARPPLAIALRPASRPRAGSVSEREDAALVNADTQRREPRREWPQVCRRFAHFHAGLRRRKHPAAGGAGAGAATSSPVRPAVPWPRRYANGVRPTRRPIVPGRYSDVPPRPAGSSPPSRPGLRGRRPSRPARPSRSAASPP